MSDSDSVDEEMESTETKNEESEEETSKDDVKEKKKKSKPGIVYLSTIPPKMNVTQIRDYFSQFGEIHRSFLQPQKGQKKGKKNQVFTEGWIEFKKKRHAKRVAALLNNTQLGGKKKKQTYDFLWNIKYLSGLQWVHINERLAYERISYQQKMRAEVAAAKRETAFFAKSVNLNKKIKKGILSKDKPVRNDNPSSNNQEQIKTFKKDKGHNSSTNKTANSEDRLKLFQNLFQTE